MLRITTSHILRIVAAVAVLGGLVQVTNSAHAATITVTTTVDENNSDGDCSLREAVIAANKNRAIDACVAGSASGVDTIIVPAGDYLFLIPEAGGDADTGDLDLSDDVSIVGAGRAATVIHANGLDRVFSIDTPVVDSVQISNLTLTGGPGVAGTAIYATWASLDLVNVRLTGATGTLSVVYFIGEALTITDSRIDNNVGTGLFLNSADATAAIRNTVISQNNGGGIVSSGALELVNVTLSGNSTRGNGGGLDLRGGSAGLYNVTVISNTADTDGNEVGDGGGISVASGATLLVRNSLIANNLDASATTRVPDCAGVLNSLGHNLVEDTIGCTITGFSNGNIFGSDPLTGPLANNGGQTWTHALLAGSPAIDAGDPGGCLDGSNLLIGVDQRNYARANRCDIGAFETNSPGTPTPSVTPTTTSTPTVTPTPTATAIPTVTPMPTSTGISTLTPTPTATLPPCTPGPDSPCTPTPTPTPPTCTTSCVYLPLILAG